MSKSSKQKRNKSKSKNKQRRELPVQPQPTLEPEELLAQLAAQAAEEENTEPATTLDTDAIDVPETLEEEGEAEPSVVSKSAAVQDLRAALQAKQKQQPKGWKQQVKAGKMANAHVPKRFNRGG